MKAEGVKTALENYCQENRLIGVQEASTPGHRFDFWWMRSSWTKPETAGVEIKVSRGDFLADKKWQHYLPYCEKFYFACPEGLIQDSEISEGVGLIWVTESGAVSFQKRAKFRPMEQQARMLMLMRVIFKLHFYRSKEDKP